MKQNTVVLLVVLFVIAGVLYMGTDRFDLFGMHGRNAGWEGGMMWDRPNDDRVAERREFDRGPEYRYEEYTERYTDDFQASVEAMVVAENGHPIEGFSPSIIMSALPGIEESDFDGVEASIGSFAFVDGELVHDLEGAEMIHSAAEAITSEGYEMLLHNIAVRLDVMMHQDVDEIIEVLAETDIIVPTPPDPTDRVVCTDEMKQAEVCTMEYAPVCGLVEVQCITAPCDPIPETFSNGCVACAQGSVSSYTPGECSV